jgi:hypothetical protein
LKNIFFNYRNHCDSSREALNYDKFCLVLNYLGFNIRAGNVLYLKERETPLNLCIPSHKVNVMSTYIAKRNMNLRREPPVPLDENTSPWQMSSLIF